ncbi:hypothetical protein EHM69_02710 [candidate division KSB1 bacterium]|nr:MAG: hypothetical protein EHM69_02710 [candidate division KSB1 bacterium]
MGKDTLSEKDVVQGLGGNLGLSSIRYSFGSFGNAARAAGLKVRAPGEHLRARGNILADDDLFSSLLQMESRLGHIPGAGECNAYGKYSVRPFTKRFGAWPNVLQHYRKWKVDNMQTPSSGNIQSDSDNTEPIPSKPIHQGSKFKGRPPVIYGEPIDFRGLRNAPTNEMGVVYLFAMVSRELGFMINAIGSAFPDCEGTYLYDAKQNQWAAARIEFEFVASNFKAHGHDPDQCDFIVCWKNDWLDCPVTVIELSKEILKLPSR